MEAAVASSCFVHCYGDRHRHRGGALGADDPACGQAQGRAAQSAPDCDDERQGAYAVIYLTYTYRDGVEHPDRSTFLPFKGVWKLAG